MYVLLPNTIAYSHVFVKEKTVFYGFPQNGAGNPAGIGMAGLRVDVAFGKNNIKPHRENLGKKLQNPGKSNLIYKLQLVFNIVLESRLKEKFLILPGF